MNDSGSSKVAGSNADLIIISPEELAKLGLLQDFSSIVSSPPSSKKKHTKHHSSSTASSSTTLEFSPASEKCESSARKRKHSRSSKNESFFKMPEASPTLKKYPVTSKLTPKPKISPEQHSPHSSKSNFLHRKPDDTLKKPVLKRNLENIKKIVSETIISRSGKKEVKVISNDAVSFSSKEINDLIRKAHVQKSDMQMEGMGFSGKKLEISDTSPTEESKESCSGIEISQGFLNQDGISIHVGTPCSEESEKTPNSLSFPNNSDISEVSCKKANEHSNVNDDIDQGESTEEVENKKVSSQDEELPSTPKFGLVNYSSNIPVAETSCIATNTLDPSELLDVSSEKSIEQSDSPEQNKISNLKFVQDKDSTKDFANVEQEQDLETDTKKRFSSPIKTVPSAIEETQCSDKNKKKLDRMFNKRRQFKKPQIVGRKNGAEANQLTENIPIPEIENQKNMLDPNTSVEVDEQGSSMISVSNESKDPEYSDDVNEEVKEVTMKSMSFPNELEKSNLEENDYLRIEEDINSENTLLEKNLEASFNNTLQKRKPLLIEKKRDEARNQSTDSNQIADTSIISVHNPELNAFSGSKEEQDSENIVRKGIAECASFSSEPEESFESTSGKNSNSAKSMAESAIKENITDTKEGDSLHSQNENVIFVKRRRRHVRQPLLVKMKKGEAVNHSSNNISDVGTSTTDTLEPNRNSYIPMNNVGCSVSEEQQDYSSISVETENFAGNPKKESENATTEKKTANELEESEEDNREAPKIWGRLEQKENANKTDPVENISNQNENLPCSERESLARKPSLDQAVTDCSTDIPVAGSSGNSAYNVELRSFESPTKNNLDYSVSEERQGSSSRDEFQKKRKDCESLSNEREGSTENFPIEARQVKLIPCQNKNSLSRRRRSIKKPVLLKRSKDIAANHTPSYIPEKESLEIGAGPIEYSSSVLNEDAENGKILRTETVTDLENKSLEISEDLKKEEAPIERGKIDRIPSENANLLHGRRGHSQKPFVVNTKKDDVVNEIKMYKPTSETFNSTVLDKTKDISSNSVSVQDDNSSDNTTTQSGLIEDHSSEKSSLATESSLMNSVDHQDTISLPVDVVERKGRPRKKTFEGSPLKKSKDTIEIPKELLCQSEDVEKTAKKFDQSFSSDISFTTEHFSTPLKKRGRSKKKTIDEEADKAKSKRNYIETETIAEVTSDIDSIANDTTVDNSLLSDTIECNDESMAENDVSVSEKISSCSQTDTKEENNKTKKTDSQMNSDLDEEENIEINKIELSLGGEQNSLINEEVKPVIVEKGNESIGQDISDADGPNKPVKKRGRPKKSDTLANVSLESSISNPVGKSKRGRKPKKPDFPEWELNEDNITEQRQTTEDQRQSFDTDHDFVLEKTCADSSSKKTLKTLESQMNSELNEEENIEINKLESSLGCEKKSLNEEAKPVEKGNESIGQNISDAAGPNEPMKKRARSKKSAKLANVSLESSISNPVGKSKRGRKPKKTDFPQWELNEDNIAEQRKTTEDQSQSFDTDHDLIPGKTCGDSSRKQKLKTLESQMNSELNEEENIEIDKLESSLGDEQSSLKSEKAGPILEKSNESIGQDILGADGPTRPVKKRGRPRKIDLAANVNLEPTASYATGESIGQDISGADGPTRPVKKRGRPRKSDLAANVNLEPTASYATGESRSGRKRKIIDYFELELNGSNFIEPRQRAEDQSQFSVTDHNLAPKKKARVVSRKKQRDTLDAHIISDLIEKEHIDPDDMTAEGKETERTTDVKSEDSTSGVEHFVSGTEDSEISEKGSTSSNSEGKMKNRKSAVKGTYIWNGQTTEMLNSVFSAAFGGEQNTSAASSSTSSQEPIKKGRRGRRKKFVDSGSETKFSVDSTVSCCICSEVLLNRYWYVHNATKHYNLAWREGEVALNLDDDAAVKQKLKVLLPKNKILVCQNCSLPCEGVDRYIIHREECAGILVNGMVTCAVCNSPSDRENWLTHKLMHNNLAWRVGDPPLDLNDQPYVLSVLNAIYKLRKPLYCDKCGQTKKSVVGYLSHRAQCGVNLEDVKVECKQCGKKVLPVSMPTHVKMVHETSRETPNSSDYFDVDSNVTNRKRKAAKNALRIIDSFTKDSGNIKVSQPKPYVTNPNDFKEQEFVTPLLEKELEEHMTIKCKFHNCTFTADQIDTLIDHMNSCATKPGEFHVCTICFVIRSVEEKIRSHVTEVHDLFLPNSDDDEEEGFTSGEEHEKEAIARANKIKFDASKLQKDTNFKVKPYCVSRFSTKTKNSLFCSAFEFTWEFCSEHYSQPLLYDNLRQPINQWSVLQPELLKKYLPTAESSCDVARKMVRDIENIVGEEFEFKQYDLFEVVREDVHTTIFCAGPIYALAWAPTPHTSRTANQILAVAAGKDFESTYKVNSTYEEPCIIQFWDFGRLANRGPYPEPSLMLGLALDYGPVWHLEWCPSGCYDQVDSGRVGLLAVAGSIPTVSVYSIPMVTDDDRRLLIYKKKPLLKLQFVNNKNGTFEINMFPTRISWSKAPGHRYIAVGYTDGMVALFDLQTPGSFLKYRDDDGIVNILPYKLFQAHLHYISVLSLLHYGGGDRWLLTGSFDRDVHMHDLYNDTKETVHKRKIITDGTWLTNWLSYVVTSDESSSTNNLVHATLHAHRNYLFEPTTICSSQATFNSITSSDWLNGLIQVSALGEIFAVFPHQLMYSFDSVKNLHLNRFLTGYTKLIDKHKPADVRVAEDADKKRILTPFPRGKYEAEMDDSNRKVYHYFEPITYDGAERKYGLVFCDLKMDSFEDFSEAFQRKLTGRHEELDPSRPNLYSLQSANKVSSNPNYQASLYFATGYQAGFVRVSYLKFLENDPQVNKSV